MRTAALIVALVAAAIGALIATSPAGVTPPYTPENSPTGMLPPWPVFRVAIAINEFFEAAAWATRPPPVQVKSLATAYWQSEVSYSLTKSGIIDAVGVSGASCASVAKTLTLVEDYTCRMMNAGEGVKLLALKGGIYTLTAAGDMLRTAHPSRMRDFMLMINEETKHAWRAGGTESLKTGKSGFLQHFGEEFWDWHSAKGKEGQMAQFDGAMKGFSAEISGSLLADWAPPSPNATVCDVGGGIGHMLTAMAEHWPEVKGVVFDLPPVAERATEHIASVGLGARLSAVGGSFFDALPASLSACDVFYLKFILHDWDDARCIALLQQIVRVAKRGARLVTTDFILGVDGANMEMSKRLMSINMMAANPAGARERTWDEYQALLRAAGVAADATLIKMRDLVSSVEVAL